MSRSFPVPRGPIALLCGALASGGGCSGSTGPYEVTVARGAGVVQDRLACYRGAGTPRACDLRIYEIMVEAFVDGDPSADFGTGYGTSHHRGDLKGIVASLDYIRSLGVNAIWLTPIFHSRPVEGQDGWADRLDATGYFTSDYFSVDPRFGTLEDARLLVAEAHARGLYVLFDGVFGHHKGNLAPSPAGRLPAPPADPVTYPGSPTELSPDGVTLDFYEEVAAYWITEVKIDGWRLDRVNDVPVQYWDDLRAAVEAASAAVTYLDARGEAVHPLGYLVGERWDGGGGSVSTYFGTNAAPALPSLFDFPTRYRLVQTLAAEEDFVPGRTPATRLNEGFDAFETHGYPDHAMPNLMLGNHDLVRFGDLVERAGLGNPGDAAYWKRHAAAFAFMAAYSGPITIYYGEETGQEVPGFAAREPSSTCAARGLCDDHVARTSGVVEGVATRPGDPPAALTAEQAALKQHLADLMYIRARHPALHAGVREHLYSDANVYLDLKSAGSDRVLFVLNVGDRPAVIHLAAAVIGSPATLLDLLTGASLSPTSGEFSVEVPSLSARFLGQGPAASAPGSAAARAWAGAPGRGG